MTACNPYAYHVEPLCKSEKGSTLTLIFQVSRTCHAPWPPRTSSHEEPLIRMPSSCVEAVLRPMIFTSLVCSTRRIYGPHISWAGVIFLMLCAVDCYLSQYVRPMPVPLRSLLWISFAHEVLTLFSRCLTRRGTYSLFDVVVHPSHFLSWPSHLTFVVGSRKSF